MRTTEPAGEESRAAEVGVSHQDAVLPQREHGPDVAHFPWSLALRGEHLVRRAVGAEHDQFDVPLVVYDRAAVRKEATGAGPLEGIVTLVGAVAVAGLGRKGEGRLDLRHAYILDDPHPGAVLDLNRDTPGRRGVAPARDDSCHQQENDVALAWHPTLPPAGTTTPWTLVASPEASEMTLRRDHCGPGRGRQARMRRARSGCRDPRGRCESAPGPFHASQLRFATAQTKPSNSTTAKAWHREHGREDRSRSATAWMSDAPPPARESAP